MIKLALVDDQKIMIEGLKIILSHDKEINIIGTASNGQEAYDLCRKENIDMMLIDIKMPVVNGVEAVKMIKRDFPHIKLIMLTTFDDEDYIFDSLKYGASGYLLKDATPMEIQSAIKTVVKGGAMIEPKSANKLLTKFAKLAKEEIDEKDKTDTTGLVDQLTDREKNVCQLVSEGKNNKEIAEALYISEGTVKNNLTAILHKLDLRDRTQLAVFILKNNIRLK